jgi:short-subunit dehydrogenase
MALPGGCAYAASKHAVTGFSESLMQEVRDWGVKVTTVFPGSVATGGHPVGHADEPDWMVHPDEVGHAVLAVLDTRQGNLISRVEIRPLGRPPKKPD